MDSPLPRIKQEWEKAVEAFLHSGHSQPYTLPLDTDEMPVFTALLKISIPSDGFSDADRQDLRRYRIIKNKYIWIDAVRRTAMSEEAYVELSEKARDAATQMVRMYRQNGMTFPDVCEYDPRPQPPAGNPPGTVAKFPPLVPRR